MQEQMWNQVSHAAARLIPTLSRICPCLMLNKPHICGAWHPTWAQLRHKPSPSKITLCELSPFLHAATMTILTQHQAPPSEISCTYTLMHAGGLPTPAICHKCYKPLDFLLSTKVCTAAAMSAVGIGCRDQGKLPEQIRPWISIKTHLFLAESYSHHLYNWVG